MPGRMFHIARGRGDADVQHDLVTFGGVVGHGVGAEGVLLVFAAEFEEAHLVPIAAEEWGHIEIGEGDIVAWDIDLDIAAGAEGEAFSGGRVTTNSLMKVATLSFDRTEQGHFLISQDVVGDDDLHIFANLDLAGEGGCRPFVRVS